MSNLRPSISIVKFFLSQYYKIFTTNQRLESKNNKVALGMLLH